jgi:hypothetical protein
MASMATPRLYHSTALLLPSGKVLVAGGGQGGGAVNPTYPNGVLDRPNAEIFSPPYLFRAPGAPAARPTITSAPSAILYGEQVDVMTPEATDIVDVTLVSLGSVTHAYNQNQRLCRLDFTRKPDRVTVTAPASGNVCPPGYYMLFVLNQSGVPSEAKIIRVSA